MRRGGGQFESQQTDRGEGIGGTFDQQECVGMGGSSSGPCGSRERCLEGAAVGSGAGAADLGAGGLALGTAAGENGAAAAIRVEQGRRGGRSRAGRGGSILWTSALTMLNRAVAHLYPSCA